MLKEISLAKCIPEIRGCVLAGFRLEEEKDLGRQEMRNTRCAWIAVSMHTFGGMPKSYQLEWATEKARNEEEIMRNMD